MTRILLDYEGDLVVRATHGPTGSVVVTDAAPEDGGEGVGFSPTDLVATGLASCVLMIIGIAAKNKGIKVEGMWAQVSKEMSRTGQRRIARLATTVTIPHALSEAECGRIERAARACPVHRSLHPDIDAPITFVYDGEGR